MKVAGIAVAMPRPKRPVTRLVVLDNGNGATVVVTSESFPSDDVPIPEQLHDISESVRSRLIGLAVDRVVVRRADRAPISRNGDGPRFRLLAEGAATAAARSVVIDTSLETGKSAATLYRASKADHEAAAASLVALSGLEADMTGAVAAALAGLGRS